MAKATPLTTIFTPPSDCLSKLYWSYSGALQLGTGTQCIPDGPNPTSQSYFSPGIYCPESWTVACQSEVTLGAVIETRAKCCPRADHVESFSSATFVCNTMNSKDVSWQSWYDHLGCTMHLGTLATQGPVPVIATGSVEATGTPSPVSTTVSLGTDGGINAYSVQIAWQASDLTSRTSTQGTTQPASTGSTLNPAPSTGGSASGTSSRLSRPAIIAIGVVVPVMVIAAIAFGLLFVRRRASKSRLNYVAEREQAHSNGEPRLGPMMEKHGQARSELPGVSKPAELAATTETEERPALA